jgi:hypothetical protein
VHLILDTSVLVAALRSNEESVLQAVAHHRVVRRPAVDITSRPMLSDPDDEIFLELAEDAVRDHPLPTNLWRGMCKRTARDRRRRPGAPKVSVECIAPIGFTS